MLTLTGLILVSSLFSMLSATADLNPHELGCTWHLLHVLHFGALDCSSPLRIVLTERSQFQSTSSYLSINQVARRRHAPQTLRHTSKRATNSFGVCVCMYSPACEHACLCVCVGGGGLGLYLLNSISIKKVKPTLRNETRRSLGLHQKGP